MAQVKKVRLPLTDETLKELRAGDNLLLTGVMYVGRDAAHKRIVEAMAGIDELESIVGMGTTGHNLVEFVFTEYLHVPLP